MATLSYTLTQIRHFLDAAKNESFTVAAQKNAVSRPAVSKSLGALEKQLGLRLFEHRQGKAILTPAGKKLSESLGPSLQELETILRGEKERAQLLRLGIPYSVFRALVQKPLAHLLAQKEEAGATIAFADSPTLLGKLLQDELDVVIAVNADKSSSFQRLPLAKGDFVLARRKGSHSPTLYTTADRPEVLKLLDSQPGRRRIVLDSWAACLDLALEGNGSAFLPDFMIRGFQKELKWETTALRYSVDGLWKKGRHPAELWDLLARKIIC